MKRKLIRVCIVVVWILLGTVIFINARGHSLLVDNRNVETPSIQAPDTIMVSIDGKEAVGFYRGDRDRFTVKGSKHRIKVEFSDGRNPFESDFVLPIKNDMYLLSVPKMITGSEPFIEVFRPAPESRNTEIEEEPGTEPEI
jgi:hypothetical protein